MIFLIALSHTKKKKKITVSLKKPEAKLTIVKKNAFCIHMIKKNIYHGFYAILPEYFFGQTQNE